MFISWIFGVWGVFSHVFACCSAWLCNGLMPLIPKSGKGIMVSAFVSSVGGFGLPLTEAQLAAVNAFRALKEN